MAVFSLNPFNTVALSAATATQLTVAASGHWDLTLLNTGTAPVFIKNASSVGAADPASFTLPQNLPLNLVIWGPTGVWLYSTAAGTVSAMLQPRDQ